MEQAESQAGINLLYHIVARPRDPVAARLRHGRGQLDLLDLLRVRDAVDVQAAGHVPGDVAVEGYTRKSQSVELVRRCGGLV